jgi:hypothetical protein
MVDLESECVCTCCIHKMVADVADSEQLQLQEVQRRGGDKRGRRIR